MSLGMLSQVVITALPHDRNPDLKWDLQNLVTFWLSPIELKKKLCNEFEFQEQQIVNGER